jgi:putative glutamine transport system substrate-binding protein
MKHLLSLALLLCAVFVNAQKYHGDSWAKVKSAGKGTLTVVYYEQPGLIYLENGKMKGMCVDIINDFAEFVEKTYGKKVEIKYAGEETVFTDFLKIVQRTNDILGVTNVTITEERKKIFKFTPPFLSNPLVLLTHKDAPNIVTYADVSTQLKGYTAEIIAGSTHVKRIEQIKNEHAPALKITYVENGPGILKDISANPKIFTILDFTEYVDAVRKNLPVKKQKLDLGDAENLAFVMSKQSDWEEPWNRFLTAGYRKSSRYRKIIVDNLGATFLGIVK